eukprot:TRINITY_DN2714_c0_g2_i1.p1 TRINITY_DN2714_c0_g2~~TRINITY_DN2714_c0_g2_i1.p1  ORF type:complete len:685 (+),score=158.59 TRINITY_DN2714_c0_g2_i1:34-2055(+)
MATSLRTWEPFPFGLSGSLQYRILLLELEDEGGRSRVSNSQAGESEDASAGAVLYGKEVSLWHDVLLFISPEGPAGPLNFVCKTPRGSWVKYEVARSEPFNPLKISKSPRTNGPSHFEANTLWHIGVLPQTWGNTGGDTGDFGFLPSRPELIEVFDIGSTERHACDVYPVKPLAAYALMVGVERISWKLVAIDVADPMAEKLDDVSDLRREAPRVLEEIREWLRSWHCKGETVSGDGKAVFGLDERTLDKAETVVIVSAAHDAWEREWGFQKRVMENSLRFQLNRVAGGRRRKRDPADYEAVWMSIWKREGVEDSPKMTIPMSASYRWSHFTYEVAWLDSDGADSSEHRHGDSAFPLSSSPIATSSFSSSTPLPTLSTSQFSTSMHDLLASHPKESDMGMSKFLLPSLLSPSSTKIWDEPGTKDAGRKKILDAVHHISSASAHEGDAHSHHQHSTSKTESHRKKSMTLRLSLSERRRADDMENHLTGIRQAFSKSMKWPHRPPKTPFGRDEGQGEGQLRHPNWKEDEDEDTNDHPAARQRSVSMDSMPFDGIGMKGDTERKDESEDEGVDSEEAQPVRISFSVSSSAPTSPFNYFEKKQRSPPTEFQNLNQRAESEGQRSRKGAHLREMSPGGRVVVTKGLLGRLQDEQHQQQLQQEHQQQRQGQYKEQENMH